ncbi:hypothetical protein EXIGLDRAFT_95443 [Exidia glandulosa HHB12029]|uniref:Uncharacterized protein n=1 Tax=Exidia glandulosa HHB12029 TaxID=1314781 RepID=A0A165H5E0_EXIGL|nr:hypothetical protein EXIGLDRAFT_95443 [Exidia glandulosa HHB12029]
MLCARSRSLRRLQGRLYATQHALQGARKPARPRLPAAAPGYPSRAQRSSHEDQRRGKQPLQGGQVPAGDSDLHHGRQLCRVARPVGAGPDNARGARARVVQSLRRPSLERRARAGLARRQPRRAVQDAVGQGPLPSRKGPRGARQTRGCASSDHERATIRAGKPGNAGATSRD